MANAGSLGCVDRILVLHDAPLEIRRADEQEPLAARERGTECLGNAEVCVADGDAARGERCERFGRAGRKNEIRGRHRAEHELRDPAAELPRRPRNDESHRKRPLLSVGTTIADK